MTIPLAFIACTERGELENKSLLLFNSIRHFGGAFKSTPIFSYEPRRGKSISPETKKKMIELDVSHEFLDLNCIYSEYGLANKIFVSAYAEAKINAEILVFIDSDIVMFNEFPELFLDSVYDVGIRPVDVKNIGSEGPNDPQNVYWERLYKICGVNDRFFVETTVDKKNILGYWNSGLVAVRRNAGIFDAWKRNFIKTMEVGLQPETGLFFVEQSVLAATICSLTRNIYTFSKVYNYPIHMHKQLPASEQIHSFDEVVCIHYHHIFNDGSWTDSLDSINSLTKTYDWLRQQLEWQSCRLVNSEEIAD